MVVLSMVECFFSPEGIGEETDVDIIKDGIEKENQHVEGQGNQKDYNAVFILS